VVIRVPPGEDRPDTADMAHDLETLALNHLRDSHEPVREFALYDRVAADTAGDVTPDAFVDAMERLMTAGRVHVIADRDSSRNDPDPFQPRYYRLVE
jgi:hypothetical protein